ncbi:Hypothetical predicted protein [Lecanosticta acicola]|uniref:F-box domain-containing protein n=1 Tax=Lecanosticta acicola TaxID=111012 RepID=A0AAI9ECN6_9PEZI|nr:Hypothetical predicted protein [Lecanosticta acicola]
MDATTQLDTAAVVAHLRASLTQKLRERFPEMKDESIDRILDATSLELQKQMLAEDQTTTETRPNLLSLPAELRNTIYELVLTSDNPVPVTRKVFPALLHTSSRLRKEAAPIYYQSNTFHAPCCDEHTHQDLVRLVKWLELIGPVRASQLQQLRLECPYTKATRLEESFRAGIFRRMEFKKYGVSKERFVVVETFVDD